MTFASQLLLLALPALMSNFASLYRKQDYEKSLKDETNTFGLPVEESFDFIIVGGGTAGCVLARRLSDANHTVLLLEAGGNPPPIQAVPLTSSLTRDNHDTNFNYQSTKQKNSGLANGGILKTSAGKMLGGTSTQNTMQYERGHPFGFDEWAQLTQDESWKYENISVFFKKAEDYMGKSSNAKSEHGIGGPMTVSRLTFAPGTEVWLAAGEEQGFDIIDSNGPQTIGFAHNEYNIKNGRRVNTYSAYIEPIENTSTTLTVRRYAVVEEILFEKSETLKPKATHVLYTRHNVKRVARAEKEIVLSTGAYISPILLIKSGIGPKRELHKANKYWSRIRIAKGVGENLMDHAYLQVGPIYVTDPSQVWQLEQNLTLKDFKTFLNKSEGPLSSPLRGGTAESFIASERAQKKDSNGTNWPDLQLVYPEPFENNSLSCGIGLNRPYSKGTVKLNMSATGMEDDFLPILDYNFYEDETDFDAHIDGIRFCIKTIEETDAFKAIGAAFSKKPIKGCEHKKIGSDEYWKCYIRQKAQSIYHPSGTCKMGLENDPYAVVDSKLRVIGVDNLRVVDASIMPKITNANTAAPVVMIAEKAANDIIQKYKS